ncbi:MAG: SAM-dependent methyltransferase, partial [Brachybacterium sp.]|nr:SAM-dependent methyltransferase [Brachybacterium sp.]
SGIAPDRFTFEGFPPRKEGRRAGALEPLASEERTMVFFESPRRTAVTLAAMVEAFGGDRPAAVARELTKTYEEIRRGTLAELVAWAEAGEVLGEVVIVVAGAEPVAVSAGELVEQVLARAAAGERLKAAAKEVARSHAGVGASELYDLALRRR